MLTGVLLHVVEAARPVDAAIDAANRNRAVHDVNNAIFAVLYIEHVGVAKLAEVVWLTAGTRIKQGLIEHHPPARAGWAILGLLQHFAAQHLRAEVVLKRIVVIQPARRHIRQSLPHEFCGIFMTLRITIRICGVKTR